MCQLGNKDALAPRLFYGNQQFPPPKKRKSYKLPFNQATAFFAPDSHLFEHAQII